jgi:hypothetical protein
MKPLGFTTRLAVSKFEAVEPLVAAPFAVLTP